MEISLQMEIFANFLFSCQLVSLGWFPFKKQLLIYSVITFVLCLILPLATQSVITCDHLHTQSSHLLYFSVLQFLEPIKNLILLKIFMPETNLYFIATDF